MKLLITILSLCSTLLLSAQSANDMKVSAAVLSSFQTSFKNASQVEWKETNQVFKVNFELNGQHASAFYDADGNLIAVTRNISALQLPMPLMADLKENYEAYWISDLFELADDNGISYYVTLENNESKITLNSAGFEWVVYKKAKKS